MVKYKHTQIGYVMLLVMVGVAVLYAWIYSMATVQDPIPPGATLIMFLVVFLLASFGSLTVSIDEKFLRLQFGYGIFRKKFALSEIESVKAVRNPWFFGWGIRMWPWPYMWIFNVSGFDAVEIRLKNGRVYRIGTDEPKELEAAVRKEI